MDYSPAGNATDYFFAGPTKELRKQLKEQGVDYDAFCALAMYLLGIVLVPLCVALNERQLRLYAGYLYIRCCGLLAQDDIANFLECSRSTVANGKDDFIKSQQASDTNEEQQRQSVDLSVFDGRGRIRAIGGGRKPYSAEVEQLVVDTALQDANSYGSPSADERTNSPALNYTTLAKAVTPKIRGIGVPLGKAKMVAIRTIKKILRKHHVSLQSNRKMEQVGRRHPDRELQFTLIGSLRELANRAVERAATLFNHGKLTAAGRAELKRLSAKIKGRERIAACLDPIISIDAKKKEPIGLFAAKGKRFCKAHKPLKVFDHDFFKIKVTPFGIYDLIFNHGFINIGLSSDTAAFACRSVAKWWNKVGKKRYPFAQTIYILCDGGGSNGSRSRLFKREIKKLAMELGLNIEVIHYPPGTSKHNPIEHRLFSQCARALLGIPLTSVRLLRSLLSQTTTSTGLTVIAEIDKGAYKKGLKVSDKELKALNVDIIPLKDAVESKTSDRWHWRVTSEPIAA